MSNALPIASADIETNPFAPGRTLTAFLAGWYDGKVVRKFWGEDCLTRCYQSFRRFQGRIYFHNGGKFDLHHFLRVIPAADIVPDGTPAVNGRIATLKIRGGPVLADSYLILPVPLSAHGKEKIDYAIFEPGQREKPENMRRINSYFVTDLVSLYDFVADFVGEYGHGLTLAGRAFAAAKKLLDIKKFPQTNSHYDNKYRAFYFGGRVQFYRLGMVPFGLKCYDINSAYPYAMTFRHAWGAKFELRTREPAQRVYLQSFYRVRGRSRGAFPVRTPRGLEYPDQAGEWSVTGWELRAALSTGAFDLDKILLVHVPRETRDFSAYVTHFYNLKQHAANETEKIHAKLFLNSFYGRFALNVREHKQTLWLPYGVTPAEHFGRDDAAVTGWEVEKIWDETSLVLWSRKKPPEEWRFIDVALAASITGFVRAFLWRSLCRVVQPVYCDTDSIICRDGSGLAGGRELGQWKLEAESAPGNAWFAGKKLYAMRTTEWCESIPAGRERETWTKERGGWRRWKTAAKGVHLDPRQIVKIALGATIETTAQAPTYSLYRADAYTTRNVTRAALAAKFYPSHVEKRAQSKTPGASPVAGTSSRPGRLARPQMERQKTRNRGALDAGGICHVLHDQRLSPIKGGRLRD